jgi:TadE-like protein
MTGGRRPIRYRRGTYRGQAMVEMALVLPIFLLILFGMIDGARLISTNSMASQAAREGARLAAVQARWMGPLTADPGCVAAASAITAANPGAHVCPADLPTLRANILAAVNGELFGVGKVLDADFFLSCDLLLSGAPTGAWTTKSCVNNSQGNLVSVRVQVTFQPLTPIVSSIIKPITLVGAATMIIN